MDEGIKRFDRDYISIAAVGKERQGRGQFLQSISRLDNSIIPAYNATSCTGAISVIWNDPSMPEGSVAAFCAEVRECRFIMISPVRQRTYLQWVHFPVPKQIVQFIRVVPLQILQIPSPPHTMQRET